MTPQPRLEQVACPLCGRVDDENMLEKDGFRIVRCRNCDLVYVNPRLTGWALAALYNEQKISPVTYYLRTAVEDARSFGPRLRLIERFRPPGTLLELGCGPGTLLTLARDRGWRVFGVDVNAMSVAECRKAGLDAVCGTFPHPGVAGRSYDAVVMNDFIEHVPDPGGVLKAVHGLLVPGGVLFLTTPDIGSLVARIARKRWAHLKPNEHLTYFDRKMITALLNRTGFRVVRVRSIGRFRNLGVTLARLETYNAALSRVLRAVVPSRLAERASLPINPGDEMGVIALRT